MATTISLAETVVAAVLAVVVVGERLPALAWVGAALVAGSLFVLTLPAPKMRYAGAKEIPPAGGRPVPATRTGA
jgi:DME family drug/metabolite transporter